MISMTGYGTGSAAVAGVTVSVELRSVNHRFFEVAVKLPPALAPFEFEIRNLLKERLARGRITCTAQLATEGEAGGIALDGERLTRGLAALEALADRLEGLTGRRPAIELSHVLAIPDLFTGAGTDLPPEQLLAALRQALEAAVDALQRMREQEGRELAAELARRAQTVRGHLAEVSRQAPLAAQEALARLKARLAQLALTEIDPQRLAQEAAILADRANISEECERLASHLEQFSQALADSGQVAKRINFLLQEMHREVNTMGAKTNLLAITQAVIAMKEEVESMREQIQNLE